MYSIRGLRSDVLKNSMNLMVWERPRKTLSSLFTIECYFGKLAFYH